MQTPFHEDGSVDYARWEALIDIYLDTGVHGLVLGSGTGQHPYLTEDECNQLYETGIKRIAGRCQVICQSSALNMNEVIRRSQAAEALGANALMILPPYLEGPTDDDGLFEFYREIDAAIGIDLVGYNIPQATGLSVSPALLERLGDLPNFNYIKDSGGDMNVHQAYIKAGKVMVLNGADPIAIYAFMAGAVGAIWGCANYMPCECVRLWDLVQARDFDGALALWDKMLPSIIWMWSNDYIPAMKYAVSRRGYAGGGVRKPLRSIGVEDQKSLDAALEHLGSQI
jgi:4-hydroxy-tetrahydrodipicolinate synthase